ncbi:hypothetical protein N7E81_17945 [Reichenbachiella carrageenanivorans]|uniref:Uncharacterized protein n=1 Tax=Reichenbachiella carrageenanivorans TaxID=2979869 RepID=A0ABY6CZW8_9BACT|nr:hypothetical protein [Reichenbachiella carrageenanivorans]UXX79239.1 hypothetical protein N7E81_17945 [Reichenbachiella carrageenanivorans]
MKNKARSTNETKTGQKEAKTKALNPNSREFLSSTQCMGERKSYLFAFGAEI